MSDLNPNERALYLYSLSKGINRLMLEQPLEGPAEVGGVDKDGRTWLVPAIPPPQEEQ